MKDSPCNGCGRRSVEPNCHGYCKEYKDWRTGIWAEKAALAVGKDADAHTRQTIRLNCKRAKTRRQKGQI